MMLIICISSAIKFTRHLRRRLAERCRSRVCEGLRSRSDRCWMRWERIHGKGL